MKQLIALLFLLGLYSGCVSSAGIVQNPAPGLLATSAPTTTFTPLLAATATTIETPISATVSITTTVSAVTATLPSSNITATIVQSTTAILALVNSDDSPTAEEGQQVYLSQYCGICHRLDTAKTTGTFGPIHNQIGITATLRLQESSYHGAATGEAAYLLESLLDPQRYIVPGYELSSHRMPSYRHLSERDLAALVQFLLEEK